MKKYERVSVSVSHLPAFLLFADNSGIYYVPPQTPFSVGSIAWPQKILD